LTDTRPGGYEGKEENTMDYSLYLSQEYILESGKVKCTTLTAAEAEAMGYEDGFKGHSKNGNIIYVDGFDTMQAIQNHIESLHGVI
jgi:hypothetical protein